VLGQLSGIVVVTAIEVRLTAARLRLGKINFDTQATQQSHRGHSHFWKENVAQAGDH